MKRYALPATGLALTLAMTLPGCETATQQTSSGAPPAGTPMTPRVAIEAPADLHDISGFLLRYRVLNHELPATLDQLREAKIMPAQGYPGLDHYAYRASGLGTLSDGRTVIAVDTAIRVEGFVWCILAQSSANPRIASLSVSLVPMSALEAAARRAR